MSEDSYQQKQPTLIWNTARGVWERVGMESLLCEHLEPFSATWATEGMMRNGQVFELPTQVHRTTDSESSSLPTPATSEPGFTFQPVDKDGNPTNNPNERWYHPETGRLVQKGIKQALSNLPTPTTMDAKASNNKEVIDKFIKQGKQTCLSYELLRTPAESEAERAHQPASKAKARGGQQTLSGQFMEMFPTPKALDGIKGSLKTSAERESDGRQVDLPNVARDIVLPTPTTNGNDRKGPNYQSAGILQELEIANGILPKEYKDWDHAKEKVKWAEPIQGQEKTKLDNETNWGKFEPAIRRWEATIGRFAPAPTKPDGKDGNHRLSSRFTEWMMGVPEGWITDVGLTRNEELKACGNGVVPQQAELALRSLLQGLQIQNRGGPSESSNSDC